MHLFCHENPETLSLETEVVETRPGRAVLGQSPFYPGGGGQLADRGVLRWRDGEVKVTGFEYSAGKLWHLLDSQA
jgi:misacylated tRNA(Ala) deacylase